MRINIMLDEVQFKTKPSGVACGAIKTRAKPSEVSMAELATAIESGKTIIPAVMNGTKAADWQEQRLFLIDIDNAFESEEILTPEKAIAICKDQGIAPAFYYSTFSSAEAKPKFRLGFIMDEVIHDENNRKLIIESLIGLFPQADGSCKNADRVFFGTDKKVVLLDEGARVCIESIYGLCVPVVAPSRRREGSLDQLICTFDLLYYMKQRNGEGRETSYGYMFNNCEVCGHHDDLVYYAKSNSFYCFGANGRKGGSIIDYLRVTEELTLPQAINKLKVLCGVSAAEGEWQPPIPFDDLVLPEFPIGAIPSPFRDFIEAIAEHSQTAADMAAMNALGVVATAIQGKLRIEAKAGYREPLNIYALVCAQPAERKSGVHQSMTSILYDYENQKNQERESQIRDQDIQLDILQKKLDKAIKSGKYQEAKEVGNQISAIEQNGMRPLRLMSSDVTPEALASLLYENSGNASVISAEGGFFTMLAGLYSKGGANIETVLKAHAGDSIRVDRKGRPSESIDHPCLTMVISLQDEVVMELFSNATFKGQGLVARLLFCKPMSRVGKRRYDTEPVSPNVKSAYEDAVCSLLDYTQNGSYLQLSDRAKAISREWFYYLEPLLAKELASMSDWSGKLHGATLRIAGLLHCMRCYDSIEHNLTVSEEAMQNAVSIGKYLLEHAKWAYSVMGTDARMEKAKYVLEKILELGETSIERREIHRKCRQFGKVQDLIPSLDLLEECGYVRSFVQESEHPGPKPKVIYEVNPHVTNVTNVTE